VPDAPGPDRFDGLPDNFVDIARRVCNWGRWGADDQLGTLNLIDGAARARGLAAAHGDAVFTLGLALSEAEGIQMGFVEGRVNATRTMISVNTPVGDDPEWISFSEDVVTMALQCATHWDALAHASYRGVLYNGNPTGVVTAEGAARCGIDAVDSVVSRGVLLDVARALGLEVLEPGHPISSDDLDAALDLAGVALEPGDVVLVRTGQMVHLALPGRPGLGDAPPERDLIRYTWPTPGLTMGTAEWFHARDVAAVATDTLPLEVYPCEDEALYLPVHLLHLVEMGMTQGQNWFLDELAEACAEDGRYDFLLDATPLPFTNGLASPLNPVVVK
jgi:kynurenine formamidase